MQITTSISKHLYSLCSTLLFTDGLVIYQGIITLINCFKMFHATTDILGIS